MITLEDFSKVELKVARVLEAAAHPNAEKLLVLQIDTGTEKKQIVAGIAHHYTLGELVGKRIVVVDNLQPATLRGVASQGMLLAAQDGEALCLVVPDKAVTSGAIVR